MEVEPSVDTAPERGLASAGAVRAIRAARTKAGILLFMVQLLMWSDLRFAMDEVVGGLCKNAGYGLVKSW
jgi:hypothetical protein